MESADAEILVSIQPRYADNTVVLSRQRLSIVVDTIIQEALLCAEFEIDGRHVQ